MAEALAQNIQLLGMGIHTQNCNLMINKFTGRPSKFKRWIKEINKYCAIMGAVETQKVQIAFVTCTDTVSDAIERITTETPNITWAALREQLRQRFDEAADAAGALAQLRKLRQTKNESIQVFAERILEKAGQSWPGQDLANALVARQLIEVLEAGLLDPKVARELIRVGPNAFQPAVTVAVNEQNVITRWKMRGREEPQEGFPRVEKQVRREEPMEIGRVVATQEGKSKTKQNNRFSRKPNPKTCWRCGKSGHFKADCFANLEKAKAPNKKSRVQPETFSPKPKSAPKGKPQWKKKAREAVVNVQDGETATPEASESGDSEN